MTPQTDRHSDASLVAAAREGDDSAFEALALRYRREVLALVRPLVGSRDAADDVAQEALLSAFVHLAELREPSLFRGWLRSISVSQARMWVRRHSREQLALGVLDDQAPLDPADGDGEPLDAAALEELRQRVRTAIAAIPARGREALTLHYMEGRSYAETAEMLSLPIDTVRSRLQKGRRRLRREMMRTMATPADLPPPVSVHVNREDLASLMSAAMLARPAARDEGETRLAWLLFAEGGVAASDTHRLYWERRPAFEKLPPFVCQSSLGLALSGQHRGAAEGELAVGDKLVTLALADGDVLEATRVYDDEPPQMIRLATSPPDPVARLFVRAGDTKAALAVLGTVDDPTPVKARDDFSPGRLGLFFQPGSNVVRLRRVSPPREADDPTWAIECRMPTRAQWPEDEPLSIQLNRFYLADILEALRVEGADEVEIGFTRPSWPRHPSAETSEDRGLSLSPLVIRPVTESSRLVLLMPMAPAEEPGGRPGEAGARENAQEER